MPATFYDSCAPLAQRAIRSLKDVLAKAQATPDSQALLQARLKDDMLPLSAQILIVSDISSKMAAVLAGKERPERGPEVTSFEDGLARLDQALDALATLDRDAVDGRQDDKVVMNWGPNKTLDMTTRSYTEAFSIPNIMFHVSIAYAILRAQGIPLGKVDYISQFMLPFHDLSA